MTMADTVAVMHRGRIEQLGHPADLYESPRTTFVANFLGQSNLVEGTVAGADGEDLVITAHGHTLAVPLARAATQEQSVLVGVRPEKIRMSAAGGSPPNVHPGGNRLPGGRVADASFTGVSTQYLVRMPWGQELTVFAQNLGPSGRFEVGSEVALSWDAGHTFLLAGDARAGTVVKDAPSGPRAGAG